MDDRKRGRPNAPKDTEDLASELSGYSDISSFLEDKKEDFISSSAGSAISDMIRKKRITKSALAANSGMSEVYLYQILNGRRSPSRDRMICLCIGLGCDLEETQFILRQSSFALLYPKVRRDAVIMFAIKEKWDVNRLNDALFENEEETMF